MILQGGTHRLIAPLGVAGLTLGDFAIVITKNDAVSTRPVDVIEVSPGIYSFSFTNDREAEATWSLIVTYASTVFYDSWVVVSRATDTAVREIRAELLSLNKINPQ